MTPLVIDFESFYSNEYQLRKLSTEEYVRDARFQTIGVGVRTFDNRFRHWFEHEHFKAWAARLDWSQYAVLAHHAHFDGLILSHHYGVYPGYWFDTLSMANAIHGPTVAKSLDKLAERYGIGRKGTQVHDFKGLRREDFTPEQWASYGRYCMNDCDLEYDLFLRLLPELPQREEHDLIDMTIRMFTEPELELDQPKMEDYLAYERERKRLLLARTGHDKSVFMSNDKFAALLVDLGVEPGLKLSPAALKRGETEYVYAFAKSDEFMKGLLEHDDPDVRAAAECRIGAKSTINETRTERYLSTWSRGALPVYLKYAVAGTFRFGGGDKSNWQNMERTNKKNPRKGTLRKSVKAPPGKALVVVDSSQIEARLNGALNGETWLIEAFANRRDVYSEFASAVYGRMIDRKKNPEDELPGFVGKVCLAEGTRVVTQRGIIPIERVLRKDMLWDGTEWVEHEGLLDQGRQEVLSWRGIAATPTHKILTGEGWREWREVLIRPSLFQSALKLATLPSSDGHASLLETSTVKLREEDTTPYASALAATSPWYGEAIFSRGDPLDATSVLKKLPELNGIGNTEERCRMTAIVPGFSIDFHPLSLDATTPRTNSSLGTGGEGFKSTPGGERTGRHFSSMSRLYPDGTPPDWNWTALTTTETTSQATSDSALAGRTSSINGRLTPCRVELTTWKPAYDLANAGPRRRFTVLTDDGPVIVHNCILGLGYQMWWPKFAVTLLTGALGGDPMHFTKDDMDRMGVDPGRFLNNPRQVERAREIPTRLSTNEILIHAICCDEVVKRYRQKNNRIAGGSDRNPTNSGWRYAQDVVLPLMESLPEGQYVRLDGFSIELHATRHGIRLPNGMTMDYPGLERRGDQWSFMGGKSGKEREYTYGGKIIENIVQALARIVVAYQLLAMRKKYDARIKMTTHDEGVILVDEARAPEMYQLALQEFRVPPDWCPWLPLDAEGGFGKVYGEIK